MLSVGSYLIHGPACPEEGTRPVIHTYFVEYTFGHRCYVHFKHFDVEADAEALRARIEADGRVAPEHVIRSPHWGPHPYCDGSLEERLGRYAEEEAEERYRVTGQGSPW